MHTGLFGMNESFVPLQGAQFDDDRLTVAYDKDTVKNAPNVSGEQHLDVQEERRLYQHYGLNYGAGQTGERAGRHALDDAWGDTTAAGRGGGRRAEGYDTSGPTTDNAMTRSEERLRAGTEQEVGRARLRKHVVTEHEQAPCRFARGGPRRARADHRCHTGRRAVGPAISEEEHEVTLRAERPVVTTEAVPVERVRLGTETVREQETVAGEVRKEQIELDDESGTGRSGNRG